ncbi:MAG: FMN-binding protein [Dethiobacteria bacterium]
MAAQSADIDVVTGATLTSNGIMEAVADAIGE